MASKGLYSDRSTILENAIRSVFVKAGFPTIIQTVVSKDGLKKRTDIEVKNFAYDRSNGRYKSLHIDATVIETQSPTYMEKSVTRRGLSIDDASRKKKVKYIEECDPSFFYAAAISKYGLVTLEFEKLIRLAAEAYLKKNESFILLPADTQSMAIATQTKDFLTNIMVESMPAIIKSYDRAFHLVLNHQKQINPVAYQRISEQSESSFLSLSEIQSLADRGNRSYY